MWVSAQSLKISAGLCQTWELSFCCEWQITLVLYPLDWRIFSFNLMVGKGEHPSLKSYPWKDWREFPPKQNKTRIVRASVTSRWHVYLGPHCLMPSLPSLEDKISSPIPQVQKKAPLGRLRCHFRLWKRNKSCYCQGCFWEHPALIPTGMAIIKRIKAVCHEFHHWFAQLGPTPPLPQFYSQCKYPQICHRNKLIFLLLSYLQIIQIFPFLSFSFFKKKYSDYWKILGRQLQHGKPLRRRGTWNDPFARLEGIHGHWANT